MAKKKKKQRDTKKVVKKAAPKSSEWKDRKPILIFAGTFLATCLLFFLITNMPWFRTFRLPILDFYSNTSSAILNIFGYGVSGDGAQMRSSDFSVSIEEGCDAIAPSILYAISVMIFPVAWSSRFRGLVLGLIAIAVLNIIRIISLFLFGIYAKSLFDFMHVDFWQAVFIVFTVGIWIYWMRWATTKEQAPTTS